MTSPLELQIHPDYVKDKKRIKLDNKQSNKIKDDIKELIHQQKQGKQLIGCLFPLYELKYRSWGIRIIYIIEDNTLIILSMDRKKDNKTLAYKYAIERLNKINN